jgi:hypothetical protein
MGSITPHARPGNIAAEAGQVLVDGPDGLTTSLTPDAAEETERLLIDAASAARLQPGVAAAAGQETDEAPPGC